MYRSWRSSVIPAAAFAAGAVLLWLAQKYWLSPSPDLAPETFTPPSEPRLAPGQMKVAAALSEEFATAVDRVMPGVVSIQVQRRVMRPEKVMRKGRVETESREVLEPGVGSGAIISKEGHIVTNWHVVEGGTDAIFITLSGENTARHAMLVDRDEQADIALLRVEVRHRGETFTALRFGDSDKVRPGHLVLAMGSPFNLRETVTNGIISHRERRVSDTLTAYLQTTCIINPGNSGGPLVNLEGDIIGIVTRKLQGPDEHTAAEGYGLAIPGNDVLETVDRLRNAGRSRTYLGLSVIEYPENAWQRGQRPEAVLVTGVWKNSPAEKAGLVQGDIITAVNGTRVTSGPEYRRSTLGRSAGETLTFAYRRKEADGTASAVLEDFEKAFPPRPRMEPRPVYGMRVRPLMGYEQNQLQLPPGEGLMVEEVEESSPFAELISAGMCIIHTSGPNPIGERYAEIGSPETLETELKALAASGGNLIVRVPTPPDLPLPPDQPVAFPPLTPPEP